MPAHARKAFRKVATAELEKLQATKVPAIGTLPPVEASRVIPVRLAGQFPLTLVYTREDRFVEQVQESPYLERRRVRLTVELSVKALPPEGAPEGEGSQDQLDDWAQEIEDVILRLPVKEAALATAGLGGDDYLERVLFADSDTVASVDQQQALTGIVLGFDLFYLHQPGDRTGFPAADAIKMDASEEALPDVDAGDVQSETQL